MVLNDPGDNFSDALVLMKVAAANLYEISVSPESLTYMHAWLDVFDSLQSPGQQPARPLCPWDFSRQEYWSGLPVPPPEDLPGPGIVPTSLHLLHCCRFFTIEPPEELLLLFSS